MPRALRPSEKLRIQIDAELETASMFVVNFFLGRDGPGWVRRADLYERHEFPVITSRSIALLEARALVAQRGRDAYGRTGIIYAVCRNGGISNFVDPAFRLQEQSKTFEERFGTVMHERG